MALQLIATSPPSLRVAIVDELKRNKRVLSSCLKLFGMSA
jgi:hypothetical protein